MEKINTEKMEKILKFHDDMRTQRSKDKLKRSKLLDQAAQKHAEWMFESGILSHQNNGEPWDRAEREGYRWMRIGENIARGKLDEITRGWMKSEGHRANILGNYKDIGVGICGDYWVVLLGLQQQI